MSLKTRGQKWQPEMADSLHRWLVFGHDYENKTLRLFILVSAYDDLGHQRC